MTMETCTFSELVVDPLNKGGFSVENSPLEESWNERPLFSRLVTQALGRKRIPKDANFKQTNLEGLEGKSITDLPQKYYEKVLLYLLGFERRQEFVQAYTYTTHEGITVGNNTDLPFTDFLNERLKKGYVGIRVLPANELNKADSSFTFAESVDDPNIIRNNQNEITGIKTKDSNNPNKKKSVSFRNQDTIQLFPQPKSVIGQITSNESILSNQEIRLGGGFLMQLDSIDPKTGDLIFRFDTVWNDKNPRELYDPRHPQHSLTVRLTRTGNGYDLPDRLNENELNDLNNVEINKHAERVAHNFISHNSAAIGRFVRIFTALDPSLRTHGIKGFFATLEKSSQDGYEVITTAFDIESSEVANQWGHIAGKNSSEQKIQGYGIPLWASGPVIKELASTPDEGSLLLNPTQRVTAYHLNSFGHTDSVRNMYPNTPDGEKAFNHFVKQQQQFLFIRSLSTKRVDPAIKRVLNKIPEYNRPMKIYEFSHTLTKAAAYGRLLTAICRDSVELDGVNRIMTRNYNTATLINFDGYRVAFPQIDGNIIDPTSTDRKVDLAQPITIRNLEQNKRDLELFFGVQIVPAMLHSLREGD